MEVKNEIFSERLMKAVFLNIILQTILAIALVLLIQIDIINPFSWIVSTLSDILSWKMSLNIILLGLVSYFQAYIYKRYFTITTPKYFTRISMFLNVFSMQNIIFMALYALNGYFALSLYSSLAKSNFNTLKKKCDNYEGQCLSEPSLFLQFGGMWMGLYYFLYSHVFGMTVLTFPHIYLQKFQQFKLVISSIISKGFQHSITPVFYYCLFYFLWGNKPRSVVSEVYSLYLEEPPLDNILNLLASGVWIGLWLYTSLFFISIYTMKTVFNIILTEPMKFPIEGENERTLTFALSQKSQFTGYLAAQDLKYLSMTDKARRRQIYTLSQPGGHPRNWNNLLGICLKNIDDFTREIENICSDSNSIETNSTTCDKNIHKTPIGLSSPSLYSGTLRNMAQSPQLFELKKQDIGKDDAFFSVISNEFNIVLNKLCQKPGLNYFFGELVDIKLKFLFNQVEPLMWTTQGLANITAASLKEDKYGIVQNDLSVIISALLHLKQNLDKLSKPRLGPRKHILSDAFTIKLKTALLSSVKRSLYKIVLTFSKYIHEIPLDQDVQIAIQPFLLCKEP